MTALNRSRTSTFPCFPPRKSLERLCDNFCCCFLTVTCSFSDEADDDDDPEYNILDDLDEPDLEDYRTDRAVQITSHLLIWDLEASLLSYWCFCEACGFHTNPQIFPHQLCG
ncbi:hypothetical protein XENORESO_017609 [Xenotaenia resolanae]|uniref:Uncharacterized protein n=1 Tax=Xenotaenia resolanae TaxID=208358 RepID=A0ABV0W942_9TELE